MDRPTVAIVAAVIVAATCPVWLWVLDAWFGFGYVGR